MEPIHLANNCATTYSPQRVVFPCSNCDAHLGGFPDENGKCPRCDEWVTVPNESEGVEPEFCARCMALDESCNCYGKN